MKQATQTPLLTATLFGLCALAATAFAQDSTSLVSQYPGDSLDPHDTAEQVNDFVVDVAVLQSSSGRVWGLAPIAKTSMDHAPTSFFYGAAMSAHSISNSTRFGVPFARNSYSSWNGAGFGINGDIAVNTPGASIDTSAMAGNQFGFVFSEFSVDDPVTAFNNYNQVVGGTINYDSSSPSRLFVSRVVGATNSPDWFCNLSQFGLGGVTNDGVTIIRADNFQTLDCLPLLGQTGNNYYRVDLLARNASLVNTLHGLGSDDPVATIQPLANSLTTHSPASILSGDITGGAPIFMGSNFNGQYVYGTTTPISTTAHAGGASTRGTVSNSQHNFPGFLTGSVLGTGAQLMKAGGTATDTAVIFGLAANGGPQSAIQFTLPAVLTDSTDGFSSDFGGAPGTLQFGNYFSATAFRGGNGPVAIGKDQQGRLLVSAQVHHPGFISTTSADNLIAVARYNGTTTEWTVAAHTSGNSGKAVYGAFGSSVIGNLVGTDASGLLGGPALSSPMLDSVGNIYFNGRVEMTGAGFFRNALVRAVYDAASFSYKLELVVTEGDVVKGGNSGLDYQVTFLTVSGTSGSSPTAPWSHSMNQSAYNTANAATLAAGSTEAVGGIVISAGIIYDVNGDGSFDLLSANPASLDQDYNVLLYITSAMDCNGNGVPDDLDILDGTSSDGDTDGIPDECGSGTAYCFGDGSGTACPCLNPGGPGEGCANSTGTGGQLFASGTTSVGSDDLQLNAANLLPGQPALLFNGLNQVNAGNGNTFGDGLRCAGGGLKRLGVRVPSALGQAAWGPALSVPGAYGAGDTRHFQGWYRDPVGPCGSAFSLTNGVSVTFVP